MKTTYLIYPDGKSVMHFEPRDGMYFAATHYTPEQAQAKADEWWNGIQKSKGGDK